MARHADRFSRARSLSRGFTLVEILVVISIISLLLTLLLPALARARDMAKTTQCASNMRQISQACLTFAAEYDDRLPGGAHRGTPSGASVPWTEIVSRVAFRQDPRIALSVVPWNYSLYRIFPSGVLTCPLSLPNANPAVNYNNRIYQYNVDASGGATSQYSAPLANPAEMNSYFWTNTSFSLDAYSLGAKASRFNQSFQFLIDETERISDGCSPQITLVGGKWGYYKPALNDNTSYPPYAGNGGMYTFRHNNYTVGNFAFVDGHVETLSPYIDEINSQRRFQIAYSGL